MFFLNKLPRIHTVSQFVQLRIPSVNWQFFTDKLCSTKYFFYILFFFMDIPKTFSPFPHSLSSPFTFFPWELNLLGYKKEGKASTIRLLKSLLNIAFLPMNLGIFLFSLLAQKCLNIYFKVVSLSFYIGLCG